MKLNKQADAWFSKSDKVSSELLALTYGTFVQRLIKESDNADEVNIQLEKIGYNMGTRMVDEFFAKTNQSLCKNFRETAEVISKGAFKMFLGVNADIANVTADDKEFSIIMNENPLAEFVILPITHSNLWYSNVICGAIRGALDMLNMKVSVFFVKD